MKNTLKTFVAVLSSLVICGSSFAGELTVNGSAETSYVIGGTDDSNSKGFGIANEMTFTATGEFGNGYTWASKIALDFATGGAADQDDTSLVLGLGDLGTVGVFISDGGLSQELGYGIGAYAVGTDAINVGGLERGLDVSNYGNIQYHLPAILPFGMTVKAAYVPNLSSNDGNSIDEGASKEDVKNQTGIGAANKAGADASMYQITAKPIDGLTVGADYFTVSGSTNAGSQSYESGNAFFKYAMGPVAIGYGKTLIAPNTTGSTGQVQKYDNTQYGIQFAVNENLTVSATKDKSERQTMAHIADGAVGTSVKTKVEADVDTLAVAYNIGGATLAVSKMESSNAGYTVNKEVDATLVTLKMAF
jgi:hypothetical protein